MPKCGHNLPTSQSSGVGQGMLFKVIPRPYPKLMNSDFLGVELSFCMFKLLKQFLCIGNWRNDLLFISPKKFLIYYKKSQRQKYLG